MGLLIIQALKHTLAKEVILIGHHDNRLRKAACMGADKVVNSCTDGLEIDRLRDNKVDIVIEAAGSPEALSLATQLLSRGQIMALFAWHHGKTMVESGLWHLEGFRILNVSPRINSHFRPEYLDKAASLIEKGIFDLPPLISHAVPYTEAQTLMTIATDKEDNYLKGMFIFQ
jgi:threonine dehydrogenase-like Zn-dependent dehydrogenase